MIQRAFTQTFFFSCRVGDDGGLHYACLGSQTPVYITAHLIRTSFSCLFLTSRSSLRKFPYGFISWRDAPSFPPRNFVKHRTRWVHPVPADKSKYTSVLSREAPDLPKSCMLNGIFFKSSCAYQSVSFVTFIHFYGFIFYVEKTIILLR